MSNKLILVTGGARSGKSIYAEKLAEKLSHKVVYLATAVALDFETKQRIKDHQSARPESWATLEESKEVSKVLDKVPEGTEVLLLDCITFWITNLLMERLGKEEIQGEEVKRLERELIEKAKSLADKLEQKKQEFNIIVVTNELGMGLVPEYPLGRIFRDVVGKANQMIARAADEVYFLISGVPLKIKG